MDKKPLTIIFLTVFIDLVGFGMIIPLGPYLAKEYGATAFEVGLLMSIYSVMQFVMAPLWGQLSDRIGRRPVILLSLLGAAISHALFGWVQSLILLFVARGLAGVFGANISTAMAYIADVTSEKDRSKGMGLIGAAFGLGFVLGPGIGGFLATFGMSTPAYAAALICFVNFVMACFFLKEPKVSEQTSQQSKYENRFSRIGEHLSHPAVGPLIFCAFLISFALANIEAPLFLFVKDRFNWGLTEASLGFAYVGIVMAITQGFFIRRLIPKYGENNLMAWGALFFSVGLFLAGSSYSILVLAIAMTILALGSGFFTPSVNGSISRLSDSNRQGEVMGVVQSFSALARIIGPPLGGWLYDQLGSGSPFYLGSIIGLGVTFNLFWRRKKVTETPKALTDPLYIGRFQLENILKNTLPYVFLDLRKESEKRALQAHRSWSQSEWIFAKTRPVGPDKLAYKNYLGDPDYPVIILCHDGKCSVNLALELEAQGHRNVFIVEGGAIGLLQDGS